MPVKSYRVRKKVILNKKAYFDFKSFSTYHALILKS